MVRLTGMVYRTRNVLSRLKAATITCGRKTDRQTESRNPTVVYRCPHDHSSPEGPTGPKVCSLSTLAQGSCGEEKRGGGGKEEGGRGEGRRM